MIQGKIQDQLDIPGMAQGDELLQILQVPEGRVDLIVIRDIIFMVGGRQENRRQPDAFNPQAVTGTGVPVIQVIHPVDDSAEVARSVSVGVGEGADKDLIKHAAVVFRVQPFFLRAGYGA